MWLWGPLWRASFLPLGIKSRLSGEPNASACLRVLSEWGNSGQFSAFAEHQAQGLRTSGLALQS